MWVYVAGFCRFWVYRSAAQGARRAQRKTKKMKEEKE